MTTPAERTSRALDDLVVSLRETISELQGLLVRTEKLRDDMDGGAPLSQTIFAEERPLIITKLVDVTDRLHDAGGEVRRAQAHQLRDEGLTQERIAFAFGVTRQRASALLRPTPAERRRPKRPRPGDSTS